MNDLYLLPQFNAPWTHKLSLVAAIEKRLENQVFEFLRHKFSGNSRETLATKWGGITTSLNTSNAIDLWRVGASSRISGKGRIWRCKRRPRCGRFSSSSSGDYVIVLRCLAVGGFGSFRRADPSKLIVRGRGGGGGLRFYRLHTWRSVEQSWPTLSTGRQGTEISAWRPLLCCTRSFKKTVTLVVPIGRASSSVKPTKGSPSHWWMDPCNCCAKLLQ